MNRIGRGNKAGAIITNDGETQGAVFRDIMEYGDRDQWNLIVGKTKDKGLIGIGYDINDNFELNTGGYLEDVSMDSGVFIGGSFRF